MAAQAQIDPKRISDVSKCLAIVGREDGRAGAQCKHKPAKGAMCCRGHRALERDVGDITVAAIEAAREEMEIRQKHRADEIRRMQKMNRQMRLRRGRSAKSQSSSGSMMP